MTLRYRLTIFGSLPRAALEALQNQFRIGGVSVERTFTVLSGQLSDQPALRSLLILIWDTGAGVKSLEIEDTSRARLVRSRPMPVTVRADVRPSSVKQCPPSTESGASSQDAPDDVQL